MTARPPAAPAGWPPAVPPPGAPDWDRRAVAWLYDQCPPDYRDHDLLRRQPLVLAHLAVVNLAAAVDGAERGIRTVRHDLRDAVPAEVVDAAVAVYERERHRLSTARAAAALIGRALRGERWAARL